MINWRKDLFILDHSSRQNSGFFLFSDLLRCFLLLFQNSPRSLVPWFDVLLQLIGVVLVNIRQNGDYQFHHLIGVEPQDSASTVCFLFLFFLFFQLLLLLLLINGIFLSNWFCFFQVFFVIPSSSPSPTLGGKGFSRKGLSASATTTSAILMKSSFFTVIMRMDYVSESTISAKSTNNPSFPISTKNDGFSLILFIYLSRYWSKSPN